MGATVVCNRAQRRSQAVSGAEGRRKAREHVGQLTVECLRPPSCDDPERDERAGEAFRHDQNSEPGTRSQDRADDAEEKRSEQSTRDSKRADRPRSSCSASRKLTCGSSIRLISDLPRFRPAVTPANARSRAARSTTTAAASGLRAIEDGSSRVPSPCAGIRRRLVELADPARSVSSTRSPGRARVRYEICHVRSRSCRTVSYVLLSCVRSSALNRLPPVALASAVSGCLSALLPAAIA